MLSRNMGPAQKLKDVYKFQDMWSVEIVMRVCRKPSDLDPDVPDPEAVALAEKVIKVGF